MCQITGGAIYYGAQIRPSHKRGVVIGMLERVFTARRLTVLTFCANLGPNASKQGISNFPLLFFLGNFCGANKILYFGQFRLNGIF